MVDQKHAQKLATDLKISEGQVGSTAALLDEGATIPFIARYRKEATGGLDEVAVAAVRDGLEDLRQLDKRKESILKSLEESGKLTPELEGKVREAGTMSVLEDIYLPYRPKRRTRASVAREKGLGPLAERLFSQVPFDVFTEAARFISPEKVVLSVEDALAGARDIIAEQVAEDEEARARMRTLFVSKGMLKSKGVAGHAEEGAKFRDYFAWEEPAGKAPSHRVLAIMRGEKEGMLAVRLAPPDDEALSILESLFVKGSGAATEQMKTAVHDSYKRLLGPSMETEARQEAKKKADEEAIRLFNENLRHLLLAPPLGQKRVLAIDPGFRTGCKVVCLDGQGKLLHTETIFPHTGPGEAARARAAVERLCREYAIEAVAIGNGTAGRETEAFIKNLALPEGIVVVMVNESGASIYSASEAAREEFPDLDLTVRGAVSIGRRLIDPLAELVKIDPKSIGVGQYQHDVDQKMLKKSLDDAVESCVNSVGVDMNTASRQLLTYVSGLGPQLAANIVAYRDEHGPFRTREGLKKVPKLGPKAFEQAAGFLRIADGEEPLDRTAVHPESYHVVRKMAQDLGVPVISLIEDKALQARIDPMQYVTEKAGLPTLRDILDELARPGRDPREAFETGAFTAGVEKIEDVKPDMELTGIVTNVTGFGAFVDIGVHQDGLVHVSQLSEKYVKNPSDVVKVHQRVTVKVLDVDVKRGRISLTMKGQGKR